MQFTKKDLSSVTTEFAVIVPIEEIQKEADVWLAHKAATVRMPGFRRGKVPVSVIRKQYHDEAQAAAVQSVVQKNSSKILSDENITPVSRPTYDITSFDSTSGVGFTLKVEKQPEFTLIPLEELKIEKIRCDVTDEEVEAEFKKFCDEFKKPVTTEGKISEEGDFANVSIEATCSGKAVPELKRERVRMSCGDDDRDLLSQAIGKELIGKKAGDAFQVKVDLPKDFGLKSCAGRRVALDVVVLEIQPLTHVEFTDEEAKEHGFESLEKFKESFAQTLHRHRQNSLKICHKRAVLDALAEKYTFDVPDSVVDVDFRGVWRFVKPEIDAARAVDDEDVRGKSDKDLETEYRDVSVRRVRLGFVIRKIADEKQLELKQEQIQQALGQEMARYPGEEREVLQFYRKNPQAIERLVAPLIEDQVIDTILECANVEEKIVKKEELEEILSGILPN